MKIEVTCNACDCTFFREKSEVERNKKFGRRTFCSMKCRGKKLQSDIPPHKRVTTANLPKKQSDDLSPFRAHMRSIRSHAKKIGKLVQITPEDLKLKWDSQKGTCPLTGWKMTNFKNTQDQPPRTPCRASVDRIDSDGDYVADNVRFVCMMAQFAKNNFNEKQLLEFCRSVVAHQFQ